jgi:hypothetical protein
MAVSLALEVRYGANAALRSAYAEAGVEEARAALGG